MIKGNRSNMRLISFKSETFEINETKKKTNG